MLQRPLSGSGIRIRGMPAHSPTCHQPSPVATERALFHNPPRRRLWKTYPLKNSFGVTIRERPLSHPPSIPPPAHGPAEPLHPRIADWRSRRSLRRRNLTTRRRGPIEKALDIRRQQRPLRLLRLGLDDLRP